MSVVLFMVFYCFLMVAGFLVVCPGFAGVVWVCPWFLLRFSWVFAGLFAGVLPGVAWCFLGSVPGCSWFFFLGGTAVSRIVWLFLVFPGVSPVSLLFLVFLLFARFSVLVLVCSKFVSGCSSLVMLGVSCVSQCLLVYRGVSLVVPRFLGLFPVLGGFPCLVRLCLVGCFHYKLYCFLLFPMYCAIVLAQARVRTQTPTSSPQSASAAGFACVMGVAWRGVVEAMWCALCWCQSRWNGLCYVCAFCWQSSGAVFNFVFFFDQGGVKVLCRFFVVSRWFFVVCFYQDGVS